MIYKEVTAQILTSKKDPSDHYAGTSTKVTFLGVVVYRKFVHDLVLKTKKLDCERIHF